MQINGCVDKQKVTVFLRNLEIILERFVRILRCSKQQNKEGTSMPCSREIPLGHITYFIPFEYLIEETANSAVISLLGHMEMLIYAFSLLYIN